MTSAELIIAHYERNWGSLTTKQRWTEGPFHELPPDFFIAEFKPRAQRNMWTYATCCMSQESDPNKIELHLFSPVQNQSLVELLTAVAHYHRTEKHLDLHHTVNFGRPWLEGSSCSFGIISLPYLDGPNLETLQMNKHETKFYWLVPITEEELQFAKKFGVEALEQKFEQTEFNYLDPYRQSVAAEFLQ